MDKWKLIRYSPTYAALQLRMGAYRLTCVMEEPNKPHVSSIGFLPGTQEKGGTCVTNLCYAACPAVVMMEHRKGVKLAWERNTRFVREEPEAFYSALAEAVRRLKPLYFQANSSGDFICQQSVDSWFAIATCNPETKFLAFTKYYALNYEHKPSNFTVAVSVYPGLELPDIPLPKVYVTHPAEHRLPISNYYSCVNPGGKYAHRCYCCFNLQKNEAVVMKYIDGRARNC